MAGTYPDSQIPRARSARQQFWLDHLRAWQAQDTSLRPVPRARGSRLRENAGRAQVPSSRRRQAIYGDTGRLIVSRPRIAQRRT